MMLLLSSVDVGFIAFGLLLLGAAVGLWALTHNPLNNFNIAPELKENCQLITTGIYRWIRHPMYTSVTLMMLGIAVMNHTRIIVWILWIFLVYILLLKARREESLWLTHDPCYLAYKETTKYFIPYLL